MKLRLALAATALLLSAPALAGVPQVDGRAYLVENAATGEVLVRYHARERLPIASITKLMTVLVVLEHARLADVVTVSRRAAAVGESSIFLEKGERITVEDLVKAALIQSANDAAVALAEYVGGGSQRAFVELMNEKARRLGLTDTRFVNPDGLDEPGHYSSARDVTRLARLAMRNPVIRGIVRQTDATIAGGRSLSTWNDLLGTYPNLLGVKTGHTAGAGWSEVAAARGKGVTVYATLLGGSSREGRNEDLSALLTWGLTRYRVVPVISTERIYAMVNVPYGRNPLALLATGPRVRVVRVDRALVERVVAPAAVSLPVRAGQRLGEVRVYAQDRLIAVRPLVAARSIAKPGLFGRAGWYAGRAAHNLWSWISP